MILLYHHLLNIPVEASFFFNSTNGLISGQKINLNVEVRLLEKYTNSSVINIDLENARIIPENKTEFLKNGIPPLKFLKSDSVSSIYIENFTLSYDDEGIKNAGIHIVRDYMQHTT